MNKVIFMLFVVAAVLPIFVLGFGGWVIVMLLKHFGVV